MMKPANKRTSLQDLDLNVAPESPEVDEEKDEEGNILTRWLKERTKTGKKKMVEVEE